MTTEQRFECWNEIQREYENIRDEHAEDVDLNWTRATHNYVMDRRLYFCYCRITCLNRLRMLLKQSRTVSTFMREHANGREVRPFGMRQIQFDKIIKKYPRIKDSPELLSKKEILENVDYVMTITSNTINSINRGNLMARNVLHRSEQPLPQNLKKPNVEKLQDIMSDLDSEKEKISEGLYLRLCNKLMGLKVE